MTEADTTAHNADTQVVDNRGGIEEDPPKSVKTVRACVFGNNVRFKSDSRGVLLILLWIHVSLTFLFDRYSISHFLYVRSYYWINPTKDLMLFYGQ